MGARVPPARTGVLQPRSAHQPPGACVAEAGSRPPPHHQTLPGTCSQCQTVLDIRFWTQALVGHVQTTGCQACRSRGCVPGSVTRAPPPKEPCTSKEGHTGAGTCPFTQWLRAKRLEPNTHQHVTSRTPAPDCCTTRALPVTRMTKT